MLSQVQLFATLWTVACQAPLSMEFSRQEYWSGLQCPPPGELPDSGTEPTSPALQADCLLAETSVKCASRTYRRLCTLATQICDTPVVDTGSLLLCLSQPSPSVLCKHVPNPPACPWPPLRVTRGLPQFPTSPTCHCEGVRAGVCGQLAWVHTTLLGTPCCVARGEQLSICGLLCPHL